MFSVAFRLPSCDQSWQHQGLDFTAPPLWVCSPDATLSLRGPVPFYPKTKTKNPIFLFHYPQLYMRGFLPSPNIGMARNKASLGVTQKPSSIFFLTNQFWKVKDHSRNIVYIYWSLTNAQLLLVWSTFQQSTTSSENSLDLWSWESNFISSRVLPTV